MSRTVTQDNVSTNFVFTKIVDLYMPCNCILKFIFKSSSYIVAANQVEIKGNQSIINFSGIVNIVGQFLLSKLLY